MKRLSFLAALFGIGAAKAQKVNGWPGWHQSKDHPNCYEHEDGMQMACGSALSPVKAQVAAPLGSNCVIRADGGGIDCPPPCIPKPATASARYAARWRSR